MSSRFVVHSFSGEREPDVACRRRSAAARTRLTAAVGRVAWLAPLLLSSLACGGGTDPTQTRSPSPPRPPRASGADSTSLAEAAAPGGSGAHLAPESSRAAILAGLRARRFDEIEATLSRLADEAAANPAAHEMTADNAFSAFSTALPELEPLLDEWVIAKRDSAVPMLSRALYFSARSWRARGEKWAKDTPDESFVEMRRWTDRAATDAWSAVRQRPNLVSGWALLVNLSLGRPNECVRVARQGLDEVPTSFRIRSALLNCLEPRWGGTYEAMHTVARDAQSEIERNPNLRWLLGFESEDRASMALTRNELEVAAKWAAQAIEEGGEFWRFLLTQARVRSAEGRATEALANLDRALARWPEIDDLLEQKISVLLKLAREEEARAALAQLEAIDPASTYLAQSRGRLARAAAKECESLARNDLNREAVARCGEALAADPNDATLSFWLGRAHLKLGDDVAAERAFENTLRLSPRHRDTILNLDYLLAKRKEWDRTVALWDAYLALEPGDARGFLERGGTHHHRGDIASACRDLRRACELGNAESCQIARKNC